jgi:hypothetical protein
VSTAASARRARTSRPSAHLPFVVALLAGVAVRVVVMVAYRPALLFPDSFSYLRHAHHFQLPHMRPAGYSLVLWPIAQLTHSLTPVSAIQHAAGIALAIALYVFLLRRGLPAWGATLATLPVLLDPLQLVLEHYVLSDFLFEVALVAACLTLLWRHRPGHLAMLVTGVLAASTGIVRGAGSAILVAFLVAVLCLRVRWTKVAVFVVGAALPLVPYVMAFHAAFGSYGISDDGPRFLYARIAPKVSCPGLDLPRYERPLCPRQPVSKRPDTDYFMWGGHHAPQWHVVPPPGMTQVEVVKDFD